MIIGVESRLIGSKLGVVRRWIGGLGLAILIAVMGLSMDAGKASASDQLSGVGPTVGTPLADVIVADDETGAARDFASLTGEKGLILVFNRSLSWCPYCQADARQWSSRVDAAGRIGINLALVTYDSGDVLDAFARRFEIEYPLLSDKGSNLIRALGILNEEHGPGSFAHGIPHPMVFVIDASGVLRHRFSETHYSERADKDAVLATAGRLAGN